MNDKVVTKQQIESVADAIMKRHGVHAVAYCKRQVDRYEELLKGTPRTFNELNERQSHKIMIEFYLAVSLVIQTIKSDSHDSEIRSSQQI